MRSGKPAGAQLELPFSLQRRKVLRLLQTATTHEKHFLRVLDDHIGDRASWDCYLSLETICREMCCGKRTAQRAIAGCKRAGWILVLQRPTKRRRCNTYRIRRAQMWHAVGLAISMDRFDAHQDATDVPESRRQIGASTENRHAYLAPRLDESTCQMGASTALHIRKEVIKEEVPPPTSSQDNWQAVERALVEFPLDQAQPAIRAAQLNGCSPEYILQLIAYARANSARWASPAGALYRRIMNARPDRPVPEGWPKPLATSPAPMAPPDGRDNPALVRRGGNKYWSDYAVPPDLETSP